MIVTLGLRVLQVIFATIVLALSIVLIKGYGPGHAPSLLDYGAFCGGAALLIALIGVVVAFMDSLQGIIQGALDILAAFFLMAGGIAFAAIIKVGNCNDDSPFGYLDKKIFFPSDSKIYPGHSDKDRAREALADIKSRCRECQADTAFLWFAFACFAATAVISVMGRSRR
ncbi:marvel domain-containing protein [Xylogone sp. PMI_703]|nr:marvel domain-containing protein [Xylogone sp. PMI_703]